MKLELTSLKGTDNALLLELIRDQLEKVTFAKQTLKQLSKAIMAKVRHDEDVDFNPDSDHPIRFSPSQSGLSFNSLFFNLNGLTLHGELSVTLTWTGNSGSQTDKDYGFEIDEDLNISLMTNQEVSRKPDDIDLTPVIDDLLR